MMPPIPFGKALSLGKETAFFKHSSYSVFSFLHFHQASTYDGTGIQWKDNFESAFTELCEIGR